MYDEATANNNKLELLSPRGKSTKIVAQLTRLVGPSMNYLNGNLVISFPHNQSCYPQSQIPTKKVALFNKILFYTWKEKRKKKGKDHFMSRLN